MTILAPARAPLRAKNIFLGLIALATLTAAIPASAASVAEGAKNYKSFAAERIDIALEGATALQKAVKAGDTTAAQEAWKKSRKGWEAAEPFTGKFFSELDEAIDAWPDSKQGYHAIEAALFAGKLKEIAGKTDKLVSDLAEFKKKLSAPSFEFTPQGLLDGAAGLAYEVGENKSKGGESPYAGTSLVDMKANISGIKALYQIVFEDTLQEKDAGLASNIDAKLGEVKRLVKVDDLKHLDQPALHKAGEELAVLLQDAAPKLGLEKPKLGD